MTDMTEPQTHLGEYWKLQSLPEPGTRAHLEQHGGPGPVHLVLLITVFLIVTGAMMWI